jgi:hypothetical protein
MAAYGVVGSRAGFSGCAAASRTPAAAPIQLRSMLLSSHAHLSSWDDSKANTRVLAQCSGAVAMGGAGASNCSNYSGEGKRSAAPPATAARRRPPPA